MPSKVTHETALRLKLTARNKLLIRIVEVPNDVRRGVAAGLGATYPPSSDIRAVQDVKTLLKYEEHAQAGNKERRGITDRISHSSWT